MGIYHYGARFYSPKLGRFLSADTIVPGYANPQAWNRYSYVLNNPLKYTDPTGHMEVDVDGGYDDEDEKLEDRIEEREEDEENEGYNYDTDCPTQDLYCQLAASGYEQRTLEEYWEKFAQANAPILAPATKVCVEDMCVLDSIPRITKLINELFGSDIKLPSSIMTLPGHSPLNDLYPIDNYGPDPGGNRHGR